MGMVFSAVFVITDGIFVGRGIGSDALASVNIVAPLFTLGTGLGLMFGMGGSVVASINLAQDKRRVAEINITQSLALPALLIALLSALLIHWHEPLLMLLGTPGELMVPAREYLVWFTLFLRAAGRLQHPDVHRAARRGAGIRHGLQHHGGVHQHRARLPLHLRIRMGAGGRRRRHGHRLRRRFGRDALVHVPPQPDAPVREAQDERQKACGSRCATSGT